MHVHPGVEFLRQRHEGGPDQLVQSYARFLLQRADAYSLPVNLEDVRRHFGLPRPQRHTLPGQHGFVSLDTLRIYLNADDRATVQQFTYAHELIEILFFALNDGVADHWMSDALYVSLREHKERLCDIGAAELVMPMELFRCVVPHPLSLPSIRHLASQLALSLTAVAWRVLETGLAEGALIIWRYGHAPKEAVPSAVGQLNFFGSAEEIDPLKKMRVVRAISSAGVDGIVPRDKSAPLDSSIQRAYEEAVPTSGFDELDLVGIRGAFFVESFPFTVDGDRHVLSLVHLQDPYSPPQEEAAISS